MSAPLERAVTTFDGRSIVLTRDPDAAYVRSTHLIPLGFVEIPCPENGCGRVARFNRLSQHLRASHGWPVGGWSRDEPMWKESRRLAARIRTAERSSRTREA